MYRHVHGHVYRRMCRRLCRRACAHGGRRIGHHRKWRLLRASLHVYRHVHKHVCCLQSCRLVFVIPDGTSADYIVRILSTAFHTKEALRLVARHEHVPCLRRSKLLYMWRTHIHTLVPAYVPAHVHTHMRHTHAAHTYRKSSHGCTNLHVHASARARVNAHVHKRVTRGVLYRYVAHTPNCFLPHMSMHLFILDTFSRYMSIHTPVT